MHMLDETIPDFLNKPFCNRQAEIDQLLVAAKNSQNTVVFGLPGMGKTALCRRLQALLRELEPKDRILAAYVPLSKYWISPSRDPETLLSAAILDGTAKASFKLFITEIKQKFNPILSFDENDRPQMKFPARSKISIMDVMETWEKFVLSHYRCGVLLYDDFDSVLDEELERQLRATVQHTSSTAHIFFLRDSEKTKQVFYGKNSPFFRSGSSIFLEPIPRSDWHEYISSYFQIKNNPISDTQINRILDITQCSPLNTNSAISALSARSLPIDDSTIELVGLLIDEQTSRYTNSILEGLAPNQRILLLALADAEKSKPFTTDFVARYDLKSTSSIQRALEALLQRDIVSTDQDGAVFIVDPLLRKKLKETAKENPLFLD